MGNLSTLFARLNRGLFKHLDDERIYSKGLLSCRVLDWTKRSFAKPTDIPASEPPHVGHNFNAHIRDYR